MIESEYGLKFDFLSQLPKSNLDDRTFEDLVAECILRIPRYCPEWTDYNPSDPGITLVELFAWLTDQMLMRFNQVPRRNYITFLELLGMRLQPPAPAATEVTFYITQPDSFPYLIPAGTEVGTERTESQPAIVFSTEQDLQIAQPNLRYFLTSETTETIPRLLRDGVSSQWTRHTDGEWGGSEQPLFDEQPQSGNCFYLVCEPQSEIAGNVIAVNFKGLAATSTGIDPNNPPRSWSAWDGSAWTPVLIQEADDLTRGFSFSGLTEDSNNAMGTADVILHLPQNFPAVAFTGYEGCWLRCSYTEPQREQSGYLNSPKITGIKIRSIGGTVAAKHSTLLRDELLGNSNGKPGQTFQLQTVPILDRRPEEHILVIPPGLPPQTWQEVADFASSTPDDRHYTLDSLTGTIQFGPLIQEPSRHVHQTNLRSQLAQIPALQDYPSRAIASAEGTLERQYGSIPPRGSEIRMRSYRTGGGSKGNVERKRLTILKSAIPYIKKVTNYHSARGGSDGESLEQAVLRAPRMIRTRDRAVTAEDFEVLTVEGGRGAIAKARCLSAHDVREAGTIKVLAIPQADTGAIERGEGLSPEAFQLPGSLQEQVLSYLNERKLLGVQVRLANPDYVGVAVETQVGLEPAYNNPVAVAQINTQLEIALYRFLNPLTGGIDGRGWVFGRPLYTSDIVALFQQIPGVRYIGPVLLYAIQQQQGHWVRQSEPLQTVEPGTHGLICSWRNSTLRSSHGINFLP